MITTFKLNEKDLSPDVLKSIKEAFKNRDIEIIVSDIVDETDFLLSTEANKKNLYKSIEDIEQGKGVAMSLAELQEKYLK